MPLALRTETKTIRSLNRRERQRLSVIAHVAEHLDVFAAVAVTLNHRAANGRPLTPAEYDTLRKVHATRIVDAVTVLMKERADED